MMSAQIRMLERGDHSNFTDHLMVPHVEVNGKTLGIIGDSVTVITAQLTQDKPFCVKRTFAFRFATCS